jgi:hypothetical protein
METANVVEGAYTLFCSKSADANGGYNWVAEMTNLVLQLFGLLMALALNAIPQTAGAVAACHSCHPSGRL